MRVSSQFRYCLGYKGLTVKEGSTFHLGLLLLGKKRETALLGAQNRYALRLADQSGLRHVVRDGTAWRKKQVLRTASHR